MVAVRILGVDPGTVVVGFACLEVAERTRARAGAVPLAHRAGNVVSLGGGGGACRLVDSGALQLGRNRAVPSRLHALADQIRDLITRLEPTELALEEAFFGKSVQSALRIGEARGVVLAEASRHGVAVHQYAPARIKRAVAGSGAATKDAVATLAAKQLGIPPIDGPRDVSDALATALCRVEERRGIVGS